MNVGGHIAVAERLSDDPTVWLGAALPDLATIGRFRLLGSTHHPGIRSGIALHHRTDDAFHASPWFRDLQAGLHAALTERHGLARGPARAVAHVGPELLLDGALLRDRRLHLATDSAMASIGPNQEALGGLVTRDHSDWARHLRDVASWPRPVDHDDPAAVARRLERILRRRPRLALDPNDIVIIEHELAAVADHINQTATRLADDLADQIGAVWEATDR